MRCDRIGLRACGADDETRKRPRRPEAARRDSAPDPGSERGQKRHHQTGDAERPDIRHRDPNTHVTQHDSIPPERLQIEHRTPRGTPPLEHSPRLPRPFIARGHKKGRSWRPSNPAARVARTSARHRAGRTDVEAVLCTTGMKRGMLALPRQYAKRVLGHRQ